MGLFRTRPRIRKKGATALRRRTCNLTAFVLAMAVAIPAMVYTPPPAHAAGGTLNLSLVAVNSTVKSGEGAAFRVQWTCTGAGSCDNARIQIPVPYGVGDSSAFTDGIPLSVTSQSDLDIGVGAISGSGTIEGEAPNQDLVWSFPANVATGTSGTVSFTLSAPNAVTPNGTTITPIATFTAEGATPVTANANGEEFTTVQSGISLKVHKYKFDPTDRPYVDQQVTYRVLVGYEEQFPVGTNPTQFAKRMEDVCNAPGTQALDNLKVVDTLPVGAQFISASDGGTYEEGVVTWNLGSSILNGDPTSCAPYSGNTLWTGRGMTVTVIYPSSTFEAQPDNPAAVTNSVEATAIPWGQPDQTLSSSSAASHALREGAPGPSVDKRPGYDWAVGNPLFRGTATGQNSIYSFNATSGEPKPVRWELMDMMPCALVSPLDPSESGCATPAFTDLTFSADKMMPELNVTYTTNTGANGVCVIPAGTSMSDTTKRFCSGTSAESAITLPQGQWITKIQIDEQLPPFGGGFFYIHGSVSPNVPTSNVDTVYNNPNLLVDRSDAHPWFVTAENCPIMNQITTQDGRVVVPFSPQTAADNGGICGYRQIMTDPFRLLPEKTMYNPSLPGTPPAVPSAQIGQSLTVDLTIQRTYSGGDSSAVIANSKFTPTATDLLPTNLIFDENSLQVVAKHRNGQAFVDSLGEPQVITEDVLFNGEDRQKITVSFPDANIPVGLTSMGQGVYARFSVKVKEGVPAGTYTNHYLLTGEEGGPDIDTTYMVCSTGTLVDAHFQPTKDQSLAVGCLVEAKYIVLPTPGVSAKKTVQGTYDSDPVQAGGTGKTNIQAGAEYAINFVNSGSVDIRNVVAYDILPHVGDTLTLPGASSTPRKSDFRVTLNSAVDSPEGAIIQYSTSSNPCRGELAGSGGGATESAPTGCDNDWSASPLNGDFSSVQAVRIDFGERVFVAGESATLVMNASVAGAANAEHPDGVAWNNIAISAREAATSGRFTLPTEQTPVGIQVIPDITWSKTSTVDGALLSGSEWSLAASGGNNAAGFPIAITDCVQEPCAGPDIDAATGSFMLKGIPWGTYELTELKAPTGYQALEAPLEIDVSATTVEPGSFVVPVGAITNAPKIGEWSLSKTSNPETGSVVSPGDTITYTLTAVNSSAEDVMDVVVTDFLEDILDDAKFERFENDDSARAIRDGDIISWRVGVLRAGEERVLSYTVTVNENAYERTLRNVVTGKAPTNPVDCSEEAPCSTEHTTPHKPSSPGLATTGSGDTRQIGLVGASFLVLAATLVVISRRRLRENG